MKKKSFFILVMVLFLFILCSVLVYASCHGVTICGTNYTCGVNDSICPEDYGADCCNVSDPCYDPDCGQECCTNADCAATDFCNTTTYICELIPVTDDKDYSQTVCEAAGFSATGTYCCSEVDDTDTWVKESYNEPSGTVGFNEPGGTVGACFKSVFQENNQSLVYNNKVYNNIFVFNGTFHGCGFDDSLFSAEYEQGSSLCQPDANGWLSHDCLQDIEDWPNPGAGGENNRTGEPLIKEVEYCTIINYDIGSVYCSFNTTTWLDTAGEYRSHKSEVPAPLLNYFKNLTGDPNLQGTRCCTPNKCWDPVADSCIQPQVGVSEYYKDDANNVYRCLNGEWINISGKEQKSYDGCSFGFCPESGQCLYNINGYPSDNGNLSEDANPQCINNTQYKGDFVCNNTNWTTRTKMLALKLSSLVDVDDNFVLMCRPSDEVLVSEMYSDESRRQDPDASNNFCVLNFKGQRIIGTTLNKPLYDPDQHDDFISALERSFLLSYPTAGITFEFLCDETAMDFEVCVNNQYLKLYYDDDYEMVVFSDETVYLSPTLGQILCDNLPDWLKWLCPAPSVIEQNLGGLRLFNKVYVARRIESATNIKEVFGVAEQVCDPATLEKDWVYSFNYTGFSNVDLFHLVHNIDADVANITLTQNNVFIKNPGTGTDTWTALTLLRNPEQE